MMWMCLKEYCCWLMVIWDEIESDSSQLQCIIGSVVSKRSSNYLKINKENVHWMLFTWLFTKIYDLKRKSLLFKCQRWKFILVSFSLVKSVRLWWECIVESEAKFSSVKKKWLSRFSLKAVYLFINIYIYTFFI